MPFTLEISEFLFQRWHLQLLLVIPVSQLTFLGYCVTGTDELLTDRCQMPHKDKKIMSIIYLKLPSRESKQYSSCTTSPHFQSCINKTRVQPDLFGPTRFSSQTQTSLNCKTIFMTSRRTGTTLPLAQCLLLFTTTFQCDVLRSQVQILHMYSYLRYYIYFFNVTLHTCMYHQ